MPPGTPLQTIPSGSSTNLYAMTSPSEGDQSPGPTGLSMIQQQMMANPNAVPYVAGGAAGGPMYRGPYTR